MFSRTSLEVQWLRLHSQCWGPRFNPWSGNKISHAATKKKKSRKWSTSYIQILGSGIDENPEDMGLWLAPSTRSRCSSAQSNSAFSGGGPVLCAQDKMKTDSSHIPVKPSVLPDFFLDSWPTCGFWNTYHLSSWAVLFSLCCADPTCNMVASHVWEILGGLGETETL